MGTPNDPYEPRPRNGNAHDRERRGDRSDELGRPGDHAPRHAGDYAGADYFGGDDPHESWGRAAQRWRPALIAGLALATVVSVAVYVRTEASTAPTTTTTSTDVAVTSTTVPMRDYSMYTLTRTVKSGMAGEDVTWIQGRLKDLGFDPGPADGSYGTLTIWAVWAFQKLVMGRSLEMVRDYVTPEMWDVMKAPVSIVPRRDEGYPRHVEIYLPEQVMILFHGSKAVLISHISSGSNESWCEAVTVDVDDKGNPIDPPIVKGICGESITPGGIYYIYNNTRYGVYNSELGSMWNPIYFNRGIAIHGALEVPNKPASHGCIRIPIFISGYMPAMVEYGDRVYVWDGKHEPEDLGSVDPPWNKPWPGFTTTTIAGSTTTTKPKSTTTTTTVAG